jgi:hypothetical protein
MLWDDRNDIEAFNVMALQLVISVTFEPVILSIQCHGTKDGHKREIQAGHLRNDWLVFNGS